MPKTILILTEEAWLDGAQWRIHIVAATEQLRRAALVFLALVDKAAGLQHGHHQGARGNGVALDKSAGTAEHFLRVVRPDRLGGGQGEPEVFIDRLGTPGLAGAEAVDTSGFEMGDHLWRWHHHA